MSDLRHAAHRMLRKGDWGCALSIEVHFDESGTHADEITLAGYLFESKRLDEFCEKWESELKKFDLPFFHMVDCAHGTGIFNKIEKSDRLKIQMNLMRLIKRYSVNGIVANIKNDRKNSGEGFRSLVVCAAESVVRWAMATTYTGKVGYYFEAGANGHGLVGDWFNDVARNPGSTGYYRYGGHSFLPKEGNPGVQAADLLAWQYHNYTKKRKKKDLARLDLRALLRHPHVIDDACGPPPRESSMQSVKASRLNNETVHYLPRATQKQIKTGAIIVMHHDFTPFIGRVRCGILACPDCFRALAEGYPIAGIRGIIIKCWCGTHCLAPMQMAPFAQY